MKVLVTGSGGFIGKNLVPYLKENHINVVGLDRIKKEDQISYELGTFDQKKQTDLLKDHEDIEGIIHLAFDASNDNRAIQSGCAGTLELLQIASKLKNLKQVVLLSHYEVGSCLDDGSFYEKGQCLRPETTQSASKGAQELIAQSFVQSHGLPVVIVRSVSAFGKYQSQPALIPSVVFYAQHNENFTLGDGGTNQWVHASHLCEILNTVVTASFIPPGAVIHVGGTKEIYNELLIHSVLNILGKSSSLVNCKEPKTRIRRSLGVSEETIRFGFSQYDEARFFEDLTDTVNWYANGGSHG